MPSSTSRPGRIRRSCALLVVGVMVISSCGETRTEQPTFTGEVLGDDAAEQAAEFVGDEVTIDEASIEGAAFETPVGEVLRMTLAGTDEFDRPVRCWMTGSDGFSSGSCSSGDERPGGDADSDENGVVSLDQSRNLDDWAVLEFTAAEAAARVVVRVGDGTEYGVSPLEGFGVAAWPRSRGCPVWIGAYDSAGAELGVVTDFERAPRGALEPAEDGLCL